MLVAQVVEQDVWLGTPASTAVSLGWQRGIFIACGASIKWVRLIFSPFLFFGQILMMCHLPNSYLSLKEVVLSFEFLAERLRGGNRRLQEFLFGCLQHHVHYFCLWIPL